MDAGCGAGCDSVCGCTTCGAAAERNASERAAPTFCSALLCKSSDRAKPMLLDPAGSDPSALKALNDIVMR